MINDSIDNFRLEINKPSMRGAFYVRKGDTRARTIHVTLSNNGKVIDLSRAKVCELLIKKEDGNQCDQAMVRVGNELQYTLRTQDINVAGENHCWIMVTFDDGAVLTAPEFSIFVYEKEVDQNLEKSTNEYTNLSAMYIDVLKVDEDMRKFVNEQSEDISGLVNKAASSETNASNSAAASASSASQAQDSADAAKSYEDNCSSYTDTVSGLAANVSDMNEQTKGYMDASESYRDECAEYADDIKGIAATKADKVNPTTSGTFNHDGDVHVTGDVYIKDSDGQDSPIMGSLEYMRDNILFPMRTGLIKAEQDIAKNTSDIANKADKVNPKTSGIFDHKGAMVISDSLEAGPILASGTHKGQPVLVDDVAAMLVSLQEDISGLKTDPVTSGSAVHHGNFSADGEIYARTKLRAYGTYEGQKCYVDDVAGMLYSAADVVSAVRDGLIKADEDIEALKKKTSGITLTSASPLENSAATGIAGLSVRGKSEQTTITPNMWENKYGYHTSNSGFVSGWTNCAGCSDHVLPCSEGEEITFIPSSFPGTTLTIGYFDSNKNFIRRESIKPPFSAITIPSGVSYFFASLWDDGMTESNYTSLNGTILTGKLTPTPTTPIPIVDASGVVTARTANLLIPIWEKGNAVNSSDTLNARLKNANVIEVKKGVPYTVNLFDSAYNFSMQISYTKSTYPFDNTSASTMYDSGWKTNAFTYTPTADGWMCITFKHSDNSAMSTSESIKAIVVEGTTASEYVEYKRNAIDLIGNLYDVTAIESGKYYNGALVYTNASSEDTKLTDYMDVMGANAITISLKTLASGSAITMRVNYFADKNTTPTKQDTTIVTTKVKAFTFNLPNGTKYVRFSCPLPSDVMVNRGSKASDYQPYTADHIDLRSIPNTNIADTLTVKPDGSGEWVQNIAKKSYVFGGEGSWGYNSTAKCAYVTINVSPIPKVSTTEAMITSDMFVGQKNTNYDTSVFGVFVLDANRITFYAAANAYANADAFKAALKGKKVDYQYILATSIVHQLTKEQVSAILALHTYKGTTIIDSELDDVVIDYITDTKDYVDQRTNVEAIVEKELRTLRWSKSIYIDTRSGGIRESMPSGLPYLENLKYKSMMISEYGEEISIKDMRVSFDLGVEKYMDIDWLLASSPESIGEGAVLTILFYWEVSSTRAMPAVAMLSDAQPMMMSEVETDE